MQIAHASTLLIWTISLASILCTSLSGVPNVKTTERNSRIGATASIPISKHQSLKFSYNNGAYIYYGGNFQNVSVAWQYSWIGWPK